MNIYILKIKVILLILFFVSCKNCIINEKSNNISKLKQKISSNLFENENIKVLKHKEYSLNIKTQFSKDTLDILDYKEDKYSSPIILNQYFTFFNNDKLIKKHKVPLNYVLKKTIKGIDLNALQTPIYEVCLTKTESNKYFYIVFGSDYCNGSDCIEFTGIYSLDGDIIYEGLSNSKKKLFKDTLLKHKININNRLQCIQIDDFK